MKAKKSKTFKKARKFAPLHGFKNSHTTIVECPCGAVLAETDLEYHYETCAADMSEEKEEKK